MKNNKKSNSLVVAIIEATRTLTINPRDEPFFNPLSSNESNFNPIRDEINITHTMIIIKGIQRFSIFKISETSSKLFCVLSIAGVIPQVMSTTIMSPTIEQNTLNTLKIFLLFIFYFFFREYSDYYYIYNTLYVNYVYFLLFMYSIDMNQQQGKLHPLTQTIRTISQIFIDMGFEIAQGPYVEDEWHNFDALNVPKNHPARDMQDTFFIHAKPENKVLRTHTSSVQIRFMEEFVQSGKSLPFKIIAPGKVFRQEATDRTHEAQFHQIEGLVVGEGISLAHLKGTLEHFLHTFYGRPIEFRFRPGYFPFVEPGIEIDLKFGDTWMEVLGAGMVHPHVLENVGIDSKKYSGFAFGVGIDRLTMMKYSIDDIRHLYQGGIKIHDALQDKSHIQELC